MKKVWTFAINDINKVATEVANYLNNRKIIAFHGEMGAGKTTFINALCKAKRVNGPVSSPTFSIINEYRSPEGPVFHIDLYRLKDEAEAIRTGVEDCLYSGALCLVEWPEKAPGLFDNNTLHVYITLLNDNNRQLSIDNI
jgi:tRNA threonylcarbamoyladenosine biosynthesis protein TsaE